MFSLELSLQIRPKLVNQVVNHTNWDACRYPPERRPDPAICCRIVRIRKTTRGDTVQEARPVKRAPSRVFSRTRPLILSEAADYFPGAQEYVHFTANLVSRACGGFAGAMLVNCVPSLKIT